MVDHHREGVRVEHPRARAGARGVADPAAARELARLHETFVGVAPLLLLRAVILRFQRISVHADDPDHIDPSYFLINVAFLAVGVGRNALWARIRQRHGHDASKGATSPGAAGVDG